MQPPTEGETVSFERTFTVEDVEEFGDLSGDDQARHTDPDEDGRVMVQGLLTATMPTKLGADQGMMAHTMNLQFRQPVYTGERITCKSTATDVVEREDRYDVAGDVVCENEAGQAVLTADVEGVIWKEG